MTGFQWFQAAGVVVSLISFLIGFPAALHFWNEERRWTDRIDRNGKVIGQTTKAGAKRVLSDDNDFLALKLAALRMFPTPFISHQIVRLTTILFFLAAVELMLLPILGFGWKTILYALGTYAIALTLAMLASNKIWRLRANRSAFAALGAPSDFRPAVRRCWVPYRTGPMPLYFVYWIRSLKILERRGDKSFEELQREMFVMWDRIVTDQERWFRVKRRRGKRVRWKNRRRARRVWKIKMRRDRFADRRTAPPYGVAG